MAAGDHCPEDDRNVARCRQQCVQLSELIVDEALAREQVHRRVAGEDQLRQDDDIGAFRNGARGRFLDEGAVAGEVADDRIHLCDSDAHGAGS